MMPITRRGALGLVLLAILCAGPLAIAEDGTAKTRITFYKDVLPILQENCQVCHRPTGMNAGGMIAPMSLMTYREVRPWAKAIARQVEARTMPPWFATAEFHGVFSNERTLTDDEILTILDWVQTGAPRGRLQDAPPQATFVESTTDGWSIGEPDLVISMEPFFVKDDVVDLNISFKTVLTEEELPEDRWIQAIEYKAGSECVHHICNTAIAPDERDDLDFFERIGLGCIAPGSDARAMPAGYGTFLPKGAKIHWGMHYHKEAGPGTGMWDRTQMAFIFNKTPVQHQVKFNVISSGNRWEIPPRHASWQVGASRTFQEDTTILSYLPHMHFRGKAAEYRAFYPDGSEELLLRVPNYDYNWQIIYLYNEPKLVPAGTRVEVSMWFDNSPEYAEINNLNSDRAVHYGGPTTDEMMNGWIGFTHTDPKDYTAELSHSDDGNTPASD